MTPDSQRPEGLPATTAQPAREGRIETPAEYPFVWYIRVLFWLQRRRYGRELEPARLWGRTPRAYLAMSVMWGALDRPSSPIEPALRSLLQVRVSQINWCAFCVDLNSANSLKRGVPFEKLEGLGRFAQSPVFSERERTALEYAEAMTGSDPRTDPVLLERLRRHFDDDAIVELTALLAFQNMCSKFNAALGVPAQGFCHPPARRENSHAGG